MKKINWRNTAFNFLSIFIAVTSAFALNSWNTNRRDAKATDKILAEIANGLEKDLEDVKLNRNGHEYGIKACKFWRRIIKGEEQNVDTVMMYYHSLTRDYISIQNISGYESLKSKGLELIENDSLRFEIITLYEYDYNVLKKFEEEYYEMQYQESYFAEINEKVAPNFTFDKHGNLNGMKLPLRLSKSETNLLLSYLWRIQGNRSFILQYYASTEKKIAQLRKKIEKSLGTEKK